MKYHPHEAQVLFAQAVEGVLAQGKPSIAIGTSSTCAYRGANGTKCAVGQLIPDAAYSPDMEGEAASTLCKNHIGLNHLLPHKDWLTELQEAHDNAAQAGNFVQSFRWRAAVVAGKHLFDMPT